MTRPRLRWWIVVFFSIEFLFSLGVLIYTCVAPSEFVHRGAFAAVIFLCLAAGVAFGRRLWQCWRIIREAYRENDR